MSTEGRAAVTLQSPAFPGPASVWAGRIGTGLAAEGRPGVRRSAKAEPRAARLTISRRRLPARPPQARAMISMFMQGGPSHIDLFDPKPELTKHQLQSYTGDIKYDDAAGASSKLFASPWKFHHHGQCGMQLSELLPALGERRRRHLFDSLDAHAASTTTASRSTRCNTGRITAGRPSLGSWLTYAPRNRESEPAGLSGPDRSGAACPWAASANWQNGWLPSLYQGTVVRPTEPRILNLDPPPGLSRRAQTEFLSYLDRINAEHLDRHPRENDLDARIESYELAARMQVAAKEALDISRESRAVHRLYGLDDPDHSRVRHALPDRAAAGRTRRAIRPDLHGQSDVGPPQRDRRRRCRTSAAAPTNRPRPWCRISKRPVCSTRRSCTGAAKWAGCR